MKKLAIILALLAAPCLYAQTNIQGSNIQIGGNSGTSSPLTTKGDLYGYSSVNARIPVGTDGQVLTADSTQALGLKWATPAIPTSINGTFGAFTFSGSGVSCSGTTCTFSGGGGAVSSVFARTGAVTASSGDYSVGQVTGAAPLVSPTFTGVPAGPTASVGTNTTQLATTAFVLANAGSGAVSSVSNSDGSLTVSPTIGAVVASLNLAHANTFTAVQTAPGWATAGSTNGQISLTSQGSLPTAPSGSTVQITVPNSGITAYALELPPVQPSGSLTFLNCSAANPSVCTWSAASAGTITSFAAPSGSWPTWLVPTVTSPTTTPSLAVAASAIPNSALANPSTTVNGQTCTLGGSCTIPFAITTYEFQPAAIGIGGSAFAAKLSYYDNNPPTLGPYNTSQSTQAYLQFDPMGTAEYAQGSTAYPPNWTHTDAYVTFSGTMNTGNVTWEIQTACVGAGGTAGAEGWSTGVSVTTAFPGTIGQYVVTAIFSNVAASGANSCPSTPTTPGQIAYRITRTDSTTGEAQLEGVTLATARSL